ncbi:MAG: hypothetical protein RJA57_1551 [Bacteroidota bacterium]
MNRQSLTVFCCLLCLHLSAQKRMIAPEDVYRLQSVSAPRISPDGQWVMYQLASVDSVKDRYESKLYMVNTTGEETIQLTRERSAGSPAWSPDNRYISFLSKDKDDNGRTQIFLLNRKGGEPLPLTEVKGEIAAYRWFADGSRILIEMRDPGTADTAKSKVRKPYEINRYQFKNDQEGYLDDRKTHLYLFDVKTRKLDTLTRGDRNETGAVPSADGSRIAYVSNVSADPDRNENTDIFLMDLTTRQSEQLTYFPGPNGSPRFSPDGQYLLYTQSTGEGNFSMYELTRLHLYHIPSKKAEVLSAGIDASVENPVWSNDSRTIYALVEDDRRQQVLAFDVTNRSNRRVTAENGVFSSIDINAAGQLVALYADKDTPNEIYIRRNGTFSRLTRLTDAFLAPLRPVLVRGIEAIASDKNRVSGILYLPDSSARNLPLVLFIHGGPVAQDDYSFDMSRQVLAGAGYAVAAVNYRGSSGRGGAYTRSIYGDWGNKEVKDIIAIADHLVQTGIADPARLGIGGWSYGGILTNYTIATDGRFKAAVSGAGSSLQLSLYGSDQYITQYEEELGKPWKNPKKWMDLSYPFFQVEQIKTPTLFMASEDDFNVPVIGAEQMYQAFKSVGIPTELVIYPGQHHGLRVPSYIIHRYRKHIDWFRMHLK